MVSGVALYPFGGFSSWSYISLVDFLLSVALQNHRPIFLGVICLWWSFSTCIFGRSPWWWLSSILLLQFVDHSIIILLKDHVPAVLSTSVKKNSSSWWLGEFSWDGLTLVCLHMNNHSCASMSSTSNNHGNSFVATFCRLILYNKENQSTSETNLVRSWSMIFLNNL